MIKITAYQWFPERGETKEVILGHRIGLKDAFADIYYCKNNWGHARITPASWVVDHPEFGILCMDPEIFDTLVKKEGVTLVDNATTSPELPHE